MRTLSSKTSALILEAASQLFAQRHFNEVHMDDVAAGAKISKVTLYRYCSTKDDLYLKLLEEVGHDYLARFARRRRRRKGAATSWLP